MYNVDIMPSSNYVLTYFILFYVMLFLCEQISFTEWQHDDYYTPQPPLPITEKISSNIIFILYILVKMHCKK